MEISRLLSRLHSLFDRLNPPATEHEIAALVAAVGNLPPVVLAMYRDHNGAATRHSSAGSILSARFMPIQETIETHVAMAHVTELPTVGHIAWLWTDDNSNYVGIYTSGLLDGWLTVLIHDEPMLVPAYRSTTSLMTKLMAQLEEDPGDNHCSSYFVDRDVPVNEDDARYMEEDRKLVSAFRYSYANESDPDLRRLYAHCAICLTPRADTGDVVSFFTDQDMWTPEAAVRLLELRRFNSAVDELERLARDGFPNGDSGAMGCLVRMNTNAAREAIKNLERELTGQKRQVLDQWLRLRNRIQPPHSG
jgi:hypothetical protein